MTRKAVALISGGLDSLLAARLIQQQGIEVEGINFFTGFCVEGHTHAIRNHDRKRVKRNNALWVAEQLGIKLHIIDIVDEYKDVVINPRHGYGANLNPCLDCKIFMVRKAHEWLRENDFDFIITGEVIGQRPKSQRRRFMPLISQESGAEDLLLRPLSAQNLPETLPEREGWVDRSGLRTDQTYSVKLQDLWDNRGSRQYELDDIMLLKVGRHIRPCRDFKLIIAREEGETNFLSGYRHQFQSIKTVSHGGPIALIEGVTLDAEQLELACAITARFSQGRDAESVELRFSDREQESRSIHVKPLAADQIEKDWIIV